MPPTKSSHLSSLSAEIVASNDDLLTQILLPLPIKSLIRFKSVSKHWLSLITHPNFSGCITRREPRPDPSGIFLQRSTGRITPQYEFVSLISDQNPNPPLTPPFRTLKFSPGGTSGVKILQSCNGLLCCCSTRTFGPRMQYYVYNPTTKQLTTLPKPSFGALYPDIHGVSLAFDPAKSSHYKVVCVWSPQSNCHQYQFGVYSSKTGPWRVSSNSLDEIDVDTDQFKGGVYWNGAIHWVSNCGGSFFFDVDQERVQYMPMPPRSDVSYERGVRYFGESREHLHLVEIYHSPSSQFNVYELERDYSGWFVKYRVDLSSIAIAFPEMVLNYLQPGDLEYYHFVLLSVVRGETEEGSFLVLHAKGKIIRYNFVDKSFMKLCDCGLGRASDALDGSLRFVGWPSAFPFFESLTCV